MHLVIDERKKNAIQIGTVMTHPDYNLFIKLKESWFLWNIF